MSVEIEYIGLDEVTEQWLLIPQEVAKARDKAGMASAAAAFRLGGSAVKKATGILQAQLRFAERIWSGYDKATGTARFWLGTNPYPAWYAGRKFRRVRQLQDFPEGFDDEVLAQAEDVMRRTFFGVYEREAERLVTA